MHKSDRKDKKEESNFLNSLKNAEKKAISESEHWAKHIFFKLKGCIRWIVFSIVMGLVVGIYCTAFLKAFDFVTKLRLRFPFFLFLLPFLGLVIVFIYQKCKVLHDRGTNQVITAINGNDTVPGRTSVLIFIATILTHLGGGSAGREGAALQMGGSLGNLAAELIKEDTRDTRIFIMMGMSAAFSAVFGTPLTAVVFAMEVVSVGIMHYSALLSCSMASLTAFFFAARWGLKPEAYLLSSIPSINLKEIMGTILLSLLIAALSTVFIKVLEKFAYFYNHLLPNPYIKIFAGGWIFVIVVLLLGTREYCGSGSNLIEAAILEGEAKPLAFVIKMLLTALTLEAGFKGGELVPSFAIGALFGCAFGKMLGFPPSFYAALGMIGMFCGLTNCPITSLFLCFELFGMEGTAFFMIVIALSYTLSGYKSLYKDQIIVYSKYHPKYIHRHSGDKEDEYFEDELNVQNTTAKRKS